ncbi:MAG TPA: hypothetical protein VKA86_07250 [Candidatus Krumholzibacteria bacterium]|nr:hypothetical protein [Candidatus Krumholzibacteria bacterium]
MESTLRWILRLSALYDLGAFAVLLAMPAWLFVLFSHPRPENPFLFRLAGLPLLMAPVVYWMASNRPLERPSLVRASVRLRVVGALGITAVVLWHRPPGALAYWSFVVADLMWAGLVAWQWKRTATRVVGRV